MTMLVDPDVLICLNLADAHIHSPSYSERELACTNVWWLTMTVSNVFINDLHLILTALILDDPFSSQERVPMDEDEDFPERDYRLHLEDDGDDDDVIFNIPEIFQGDEDDVWGSEDEVLGPDSGHLEIEDQDQDLGGDNYSISDEAHRPSHGHIPDVIIQL